MIPRPFTLLIDLLTKSIDDKCVIQFKLDHSWRTVEPYMLGFTPDEQSLGLFGYCRDVVVNGQTPSRWQLFRLEEMQEVEITNYRFEPHSQYKGKTELVRQVAYRL
jgi:hypothetical protein